MSEITQEFSTPSTSVIEATAGTYYRWARFIMAAVLLFYGLASLRDGFSRWPAENAIALKKGADKPPHNDMGILINKLCGVALPPLGVAMVIWTLYRSRGKYRLADGILTSPGHPPAPLDQIQALDQSRWDRKGIAVVEYTSPDGKTGRITLDDFVYDRDGIDAIVKRIAESLAGPAKTGGPKPTSPPPAAAPQTSSPPRIIPAPRPSSAPVRLPPRPKL